jgi:hypothetical protein
MRTKPRRHISLGFSSARKTDSFVRQSPDNHHHRRPQVEPTDVISRNEQITNFNILADVANPQNRAGDHSKCLLPAEIAADLSTC